VKKCKGLKTAKIIAFVGVWDGVRKTLSSSNAADVNIHEICFATKLL